MIFYKMEGLGNDYIYLPDTADMAPEQVRKMSDRHFGIGGDGVVLISSSGKADFAMRIFNADGSEAEMCGNAIRCVGKLAADLGFQKKTVAIETKAGIKTVFLLPDGRVKVDMGEPEIRSIGQEITLPSHHKITLAVLSMGNPHAVVFVPQITDAMVCGQGPEIENHPLFAHKTNVEFVRILDRNNIQMRVWERGAGETLACGTGACAAVVAAAAHHLTERAATVHLRGGDLAIDWDEKTNHIFKTGPANIVFKGEYAWSK